MPLNTPRFRWLLMAGFGAALVLTLFFGARLTLQAIYWADPAHRDLPIQSWMPLGYVGRTWNVPREAMLEIAGVPASSAARRSLEVIARDEGVPLDELIARIQTGIAAYRETQND